MHWTIAAPFIQEANDSDWLTPFVPGKRHHFSVIPRQGVNQNWHNRASSVTDKKEWLEFWHQSKEALQTTQGGVITVFPQLAAMMGVRQRLARKHIPVVAWWFNTNAYSGIKAWLAQNSLQSIDRLIVHTRCEREFYSQWLGIPLECFEFVPLQVGEIPVTYAEETDNPFILATGSAYRDYPTLFEAVSRLGIKTVVVSGPRTLQGLNIPSHVETPFGLKKHEIMRLVQQARLNIVPMVPEGVTAGIVTIAEAMRLGRAVIATRRSGVEDYIKDEDTGLLVKPNSVDDLTQAIDRLWNDEELRNRLGRAAGCYAAEHFSDEAAGVALGRVLDSVADERGMY